jgi:hypothetical protein
MSVGSSFRVELAVVVLLAAVAVTSAAAGLQPKQFLVSFWVDPIVDPSLFRREV